MVYSFARVGAVVTMRVKDYFVRLHENGGKRHNVTAHHNAEAYMEAYLKASDKAQDKKRPLFKSINLGCLNQPISFARFLDLYYLLLNPVRVSIVSDIAGSRKQAK
jgi:hypothetical protein